MPNEQSSLNSAAVPEILIYGDIGFDYGLTARSFIQQLDAFGNVAELSIRINSQGGIVDDGIAIYQALARNSAQKTVHIDSACYSIAAVVAMAASPGKLCMAFNARLMIHNAWNILAGDKNDMAKEAERLGQLDGILAAMFGKRAKGKSNDEMLEMMNEETWFTAEEAMSIGLVDQVEDPSEESDPMAMARNKFDPMMRQRYKRMPEEVAKLYTKPIETDPADVERQQARDRVEMAYRWAELRAAG